MYSNNNFNSKFYYLLSGATGLICGYLVKKHLKEKKYDICLISPMIMIPLYYIIDNSSIYSNHFYGSVMTISFASGMILKNTVDSYSNRVITSDLLNF